MIARSILSTRVLLDGSTLSLAGVSASLAKMKCASACSPSLGHPTNSTFRVLQVDDRIQARSFKMAWRNQGITGSNNIPLGNRRRFGGDDGDTQDGGYTPSSSSAAMADASYKRGRSPIRGTSHGSCQFETHTYTSATDPVVDDGVKRRKKRNRWGDAQENKAAGLMGLPTMIMANMTTEQLEAYTLHLRIEEISQKLRINDVVPADGDR